MANIKQIAEHSVDLDLLSWGICIDVGCRGFQFSEAMRDLGCIVFAYDIDDIQPPERIYFSKVAITDKQRTAYVVDTKDLQAKYLSDSGGRLIETVSLNSIYEANNELTFDILKLDCEGEEYRILSDSNFQPIPRQITVEFHEHAHKALHDQYFRACMDNLLKHYVAVKHDRYAAHGAGFNFWDSLFIRRDLV